MAQTPHILIIGAGLIGLASARALVDRGAKVTIAEKKSGAGQGAGFANSGMIHPSQARPWLVADDVDMDAQMVAAADVAGLATRSVELIKSRMAALGLPDIKRSKGCSQLYSSEARRAEAKARYEMIGIEVSEATQLGRPALIFPQDFSGSAYDWSVAEAKALSDEGAEFIYTADIYLTQIQGRLVVRIDDKTLSFDHVIVASGAGSRELLRPLDIDLPIVGKRGFGIDFDASHISRADYPDVFEGQTIGVPIMDGPSRSAFTDFGQSIRLSGTIDQISANPLWTAWLKIIPSLIAELGQPKRIWSGERPVCLLGRPIIGPAPVKNLWVNCGHGHMGWTLSMPSGELMAQMILEGQSDSRFTLN